MNTRLKPLHEKFFFSVQKLEGLLKHQGTVVILSIANQQKHSLFSTWKRSSIIVSSLLTSPDRTERPSIYLCNPKYIDE